MFESVSQVLQLSGASQVLCEGYSLFDSAVIVGDPFMDGPLLLQLPLLFVFLVLVCEDESFVYVGQVAVFNVVVHELFLFLQPFFLPFHFPLFLQLKVPLRPLVNHVLEVHRLQHFPLLLELLFALLEFGDDVASFILRFQF